MALVFQYGSNMSMARINSDARLRGDAKLFCVAKTEKRFDFSFTIFSDTNNCASADIVPNENGENIYGVVYEIPDFLLSRDTAEERGRKSLDAIEGAGKNYIRKSIDLIKSDGSKLTATTYFGNDRKPGRKTSLQYVQYIFDGLKEHKMPDEYCSYVRSRIIENNGELSKFLY